MTTTCKSCNATLEFEPVAGFPNLIPTLCDACNAKIAEARKTVELDQRRTKFYQLCPALYQDTDLNHPSIPAAASTAILAWEFGPKGLLVRGASRCCKSRLMWELLRKQFMAGRDFTAYTAVEFSDASATAWGSGDAAAAEFKRDCIGSDILFIDDLGKAKLTERTEADLFDIVDRRITWKRPCLFTTNMTGTVLLQQMSPDRGVPFVERLREFCSVVKV